MQDWTGIVEAARVAGWIIYPLTLLALVALFIILDRLYVFWRFARVPDIASYGGDISALIATLAPQHALRRLLTPLVGEFTKPAWWLEERASALALDVQRDISRGLWVLETIVTAAPLVGLLGTIVGMMHAFRLIGGNELVNPTGVTGGVAQALVATALGLVIALVALFAFNYFSRRIDRLVEELETFTSAWLADIKLAREEASSTSAAASAASASAISGATAVRIGASRPIGAKP
ncbi:MotA/TolQ/ExbB proton channel family protein [Paraburkholderia sp. SARCC-3016]|uniref:MotA/TolQ/ExbB proton channel family protein n=1 Tax=Paraburkholderia sp. SARCC-3016 TaxID=3058611 RepID=UPI0028090823|nr:MotA/TolQ/ExbB proton channel family protein [Paraburkholderia sp. SARCC-3016]MDQ7979389.1 MotA/TolQ/ExbB proton channel family protein [Paraburkholderia sp. SARCC-3016]